MDMNNNFADRLLKAIDEKNNPTVAGLDPAFEKLPPHILEKYSISVNNSDTSFTFAAAAEAVLEFNKGIIDAVCHIVPAVKLQVAYYEQLGPAGMECFLETSQYAKEKKLLIIADAKRNDIGTTCEAYSNAFLGKIELFGKKTTLYNADSLTVNGYLGFEGVEPFLNDCKEYGKGIFILVKTSNKGSEEFQSLTTPNGKNYAVMGTLVSKWGKPLTGNSGYNSVGAVVGATFPEEAEELRKIMPNTIFLVPGYGAQGGAADDTMPCFNSDGTGAIVNSSRGIIFAYMKNKDGKNYQKYAENEALRMKSELTASLQKKKICRW